MDCPHEQKLTTISPQSPLSRTSVIFFIILQISYKYKEQQLGKSFDFYNFPNTVSNISFRSKIVIRKLSVLVGVDFSGTIFFFEEK